VSFDVLPARAAAALTAVIVPVSPPVLVARRVGPDRPRDGAGEGGEQPRVLEPFRLGDHCWIGHERARGLRLDAEVMACGVRVGHEASRLSMVDAIVATRAGRGLSAR
jgi:hypothetical protein